MKAKKYEKVNKLPATALKVSAYAELVGQANPPYICIAYDRFLKGGADPGYKIVNWQGFNFVIPHK